MTANGVPSLSSYIQKPIWIQCTDTSSCWWVLNNRLMKLKSFTHQNRSTNVDGLYLKGGLNISQSVPFKGTNITNAFERSSKSKQPQLCYPDG